MADNSELDRGVMLSDADPFRHARDLIARKKWDAATAECSALLQKDETAVEALCLLGVISYRLGDLSGAIGLFERAVEAPGASSDVPEILAVLYAKAGRIHDALYYAKRAMVFPLDKRILGLLYPDFPSFGAVFATISERPLYFEGLRCLEDGEYSRAVSRLQQNLALEPQHEPTMAALGTALLGAGKAAAAVNILRSLRATAPASPHYISLLAQALVASGDHAAGRACHLQATAMAPDDVGLLCAFLRDSISDPDFPATVASEQWRRLAALLQSDGHVDEGQEADATRPLAVGLICQPNPGVFATMASEVLRHRNRTRLQIRGYGFGSLSTQRNQCYRAAVDTWSDIGALDHYTAAEIIRNDEIDVLVDLCGLTQSKTLEILAQRPAPLQVAWLETTSPEALPNIDYLLTGPSGKRDEKRLWALPRVPWAMEKTGPCRTHAADAGGVVLGADIGLKDLVPELVMAWSEILRRVPQATLVLRQAAFSLPDDTARLVDLFGNFGIAHRIDMVDAADSASFAADCDLVLLPLGPVSPHFATQALAAGTPVLISSTGSAAEIIAQSLTLLGLDDCLIAVSREDYVEKAVALASAPGRLSGLRQEIGAKVIGNGFAVPAALMDDLQDAFIAMSAARNN